MSRILTIHDLSSELLTCIFQKVPLDDRKNVRLSCSWFYDACNQVSILKNEKLIFRKLCSIEEIIENISVCKYLILNLEFQSLPLDKLDENFWKTYGCRIYSLIFYKCNITNKTIKNVIIYCENLKYWSLYTNIEVNDRLRHTVKVFYDLLEAKIIRIRLETFKIFLHDDPIWSSVMEIIFQIFPNIKKFITNCWCTENINRVNSPLYSTNEFTKFATWNRIDKWIKPSLVEKLYIDIPNHGHWLKYAALFSNFRLKEIQMYIILNSNVFNSLIQFFSKQNRLEVVHVIISNITEPEVKILLLHILKECPRLRELCLNYVEDFIINITWEEFAILAKFPLNKLSFSFNISDVPIPNRINNIPFNNHLKCLAFTGSKLVDENSCVTLIEYYKNLEWIELCWPSDKVLQAIFQYQIKLRVLKLTNVDNCTDYGFIGRIKSMENNSIESYGYSIKRLQNLECFELHGYCRKLSATAIREFIFPNLKHVYFNFSWMGPLKVSLMTFIRNAPLLTIATFLNIHLSYDLLLRICKNSKKLYYVDCSNVYNLPKNEELMEIFNFCPTLRFFTCSWNTYNRDVFKNKLYMDKHTSFKIRKKCTCKSL